MDRYEASVQIVNAYLNTREGGHTLPADLGPLVQSVYNSLEAYPPDEIRVEAKPTPAVPISESIHKDHLVCLECGKEMKMLKRHLRVDHDLTPPAYRDKWQLPPDYPMTASAYAAVRSASAKKNKLGRRKNG
jgi:predicted transcriptional regulator